MAIDSREKRAGAISAGVPFIVISPIADGSIGAADRQQIVNVYPGVLAGVPVTPSSEVIHGMIRIIRMVRTKLLPYGSMYIE